MIETRLMRYFLAVTREGTITHAAESLHVTQSTLSKQLMDLERRLGVQLLVRGKREVTLTDEGRYFKSRAEEALALIDKTEAELRGKGGEVSGDIHLGCAQMASMRHVTATMARFQETHPLVRFHLYSGDADRVMEKLGSGAFDAGILLEPAHEERFEYEPLPLRESFGLLVAKKSPAGLAPVSDGQDLLDVPLVMPDQAVRPAREEWFAGLYDQFRIVATYDLIGNAAYWAEQGIAGVLALGGLVSTEGTDLAFVPIEPTIEIGVSLVTKRFRVPSGAARLFLEALRESLAQEGAVGTLT